MSYEKTTWETGDVITAEKLNNIENGIANSVVTLSIVAGEPANHLDKTWSEINALIEGGSLVLIKQTTEYATSIAFVVITGIMGESVYGVVGIGFNSNGQASPLLLATTSEDGYPAFGQN